MKRFMTAVAVLCLTGLVMGCGPQWARSPVAKNRDMQVSLEKQQSPQQQAGRRFQHPFDMDAGRLKVFLDQLQYEKDSLILGKVQELPVFEDKEIERLAPAIVDALAKAGPRQRVRFISYNKGGIFIFQKPRRTGGVLFVDKAGRLNLAFSYVNYVIKDKEIRTTYTKNLYSDPLQENTADTRIKGPGYASYYRGGAGQEKPWWLVADAADVGRRVKTPPEKQERAQPAEPAGVQKEKVRQKPAAVGEKTFAPAPRVAGEEKKSGGDTAAEGWSRRKKEIRQKLEYLKELYESDLISSEEYKRQKQQVLEKLR
ncbi:MAG TPA: SHOCT domain-containing protein [Desulfosalsimonadaceae bacterium]|nr:SHOCT domain-containing protein [Desulfosalsimonadaceae bacterium]